MRRARSRLGLLAFVGGLAAACAPSFSDDTSIVAAPRLLAVQTAPAEAAPGASFTTMALYVGPDGGAAASSLDWAECLLQKPLGDPDSIASGCFVARSSSLVPLGSGPSVAGTIPSAACELFGPESPPPAAGQPAARPTDPDATGGFYLPLRIGSSGDQWSAALQRIACQPSGVTQSVFTAFSTEYVVNQNPTLASLVRLDAQGNAATNATTIDPDGASSAPLAVASGATVTLRASWPDCALSPVACSGAETFVLVDPTTKQLTTQREAIVTSWYATGGSFALDRVGRDGTERATTADNPWTAPTAPGLVHLWVVIRDARGGVGWESYTLSIE